MICMAEDEALKQMSFLSITESDAVVLTVSKHAIYIPGI